MNHKIKYALMIPLGLLVANALSYMPYFSDDSFISLRYSQRLLEGHGLTWTDGIPVEGYSNLLWVLACAFLGKLGLNLILSARLLGILSFTSILIINYHFWKNRVASKNELNALIWAQCIFALSAPVAVWSIGGLEQPFIALFLSFAVIQVYLCFEKNTLHHIFLASASLALLCLSRPDSPLLCTTLALGIVWSYGLNKSSILRICLLALLPILAVIAQLLFRYHYYGDIVPNTAYIKVVPSLYHLGFGALYALCVLLFLFPVSLILYRYCFKKSLRINHPLVRLIVPSLLGWLLYIIFIGGDHFAGLRHAPVLIAISTIAMPVILQHFFSTGWLEKTKQVKQYVLIFIFVQLLNPFSVVARIEHWEWDALVLSNVFISAFADKQPSIALTAAGGIPYFTQFPVIDMLGLNDYYIARNPLDDPKNEPIGHGYGNGVYVLEQNPDIISFCNTFIEGGGICFRAEKQLIAQQVFWDKYVKVYIKGSKPHEYTGLFWFNKYSKKIGIQQSATEIVIPAYLLAESTKTVAQLDMTNKLAIGVSKQHPAAIKNLKLDYPLKRMSIKPENKDINIKTVFNTETQDWNIYLTSEKEESVFVQKIISR